MNSFFLAIELLSYAFAVFLFLKKKELAVVYLPVLIFANNLIEPVIPASAFYLTISGLVFSLIFRNPSYYKNNIPAFLLFLYTIILLPRSTDLVFIRPFVFAMLWLLTVIPVIASIYKKYPKELIFKELTTSALIILVMFVANVLVSTVKGYSPHEMYGITKGILYGNVYAAGFNILSIAVFIIALGFINNKKIFHLLILTVAFSFIMLSLRRSVMGVSLVGVALAYLTLLTKENAKLFFVLSSLTIMLGVIVYSTTDIEDQFSARYELRKLDERELAEEKRFIEYELLYKDMFVYRDYDPLIGYEPFNSWGNYGRGILEDRSLHGDLTNITHSSGLIGLLLYLLMVMTAFRKSYRASETRTDKLIVLFCGMAFIAYTITGRYTEIGSVMLLYLVLMLPLSKSEAEMEEEPELEQEDDELAPYHKLSKKASTFSA